MDINKIIEEVTRQVGGVPTWRSASYTPYSTPAGPAEHGNHADIITKLEHSMLNPDLSPEKLEAAEAVARKYGVAALCVSPYYVPKAVEMLRGSTVAVDTAIGFPHGAMSSAAKIAEVKECIRSGAKELDVAINVLAVKAGCWEDVVREFAEIAAIANGKAIVKAVFEHCLYTEDEKVKVLRAVCSAGADYIKIQNMLSGKGASSEDVRFVRGIVGPRVGIKIDGGVKTLAFACELVDAGADRIGLTATEAIAKEALGIV